MQKTLVKFQQSAQEKEKPQTKAQAKAQKYDYILLGVVIIIVIFGLIMLFSSSSMRGLKTKGDGMFFVKGQIRGIIAGVAAMLFFMKLDYRNFKKYSITIYFLCLVCLILVYVPGLGREGPAGQSINGADRWIMIGGMSVQPSELAKFGLIFMIAARVENFGQMRMQNFRKGVLPILILTGLIAGIILKQPNFSIFTIISMTCFSMLMFSGVKWSHLVILGVVAVVAGGAIMMLKTYRVNRVMTFRDPWKAGSDKGTAYQIQQSIYAISPGGLFGKGLGQSTQKNMFLPLNESDFIFAIIAEEIGFFGCLILLFGYVILIWRGLRTAWYCQDMFGKLSAAGITTLIAFQVFVNIAVVTSTIPTTGVPLPFISYGSTSMLCFLAAIGILLNISKKAKAG